MKNSDRLHSFFATIVRPHYQLLILGMTSLVIIYFLYASLNMYRPLEQSTTLLPITPNLIKEWGAEPTVVDTGLFITNWHEFDVRYNKFIFDGIVWFQFNPALISLDTIGKFSFEKGEILEKSEPDTKLINGKIFAEYQVRLRFTTNLNYQLFPLDDHEVYVAMINTAVSPREVVFKVKKSNFVISENVFTANWRQVDHEVASGYEQQQLDKYDSRKTIYVPKVIYTLHFRRSGVNLIMLIFIPIFLIFFLALFSFAFDPASAQMPIVIIATTALTSLIAYRFVIQRLSPAVGYLLFSDAMFMLFLSFSFMIFVIGMAVVKAAKLGHPLVIARGVIFLLFHALLIITWIYLLFYWIE